MADRDRLAHLPGFPDLTVPRPAANDTLHFRRDPKAATTPTKIKTVVRPRATSAELFFLDTMTEPDTLRIQLSRAWWQSGKPGPYPRIGGSVSVIA